jgi:hypothetical protein
VTANLGALVRAAYECRRRAASAQLKGQSLDEAACERSTRASYDAENATLAGSPACLDVSTPGADMLADVAAMSARINCAP